MRQVEEAFGVAAKSMANSGRRWPAFTHGHEVGVRAATRAIEDIRQSDNEWAEEAGATHAQNYVSDEVSSLSRAGENC